MRAVMVRWLVTGMAPCDRAETDVGSEPSRVTWMEALGVADAICTTTRTTRCVFTRTFEWNADARDASARRAHGDEGEFDRTDMRRWIDRVVGFSHDDGHRARCEVFGRKDCFLDGWSGAVGVKADGCIAIRFNSIRWCVYYLVKEKRMENQSETCIVALRRWLPLPTPL